MTKAEYWIRQLFRLRKDKRYREGALAMACFESARPLTQDEWRALMLEFCGKKVK